MCNIVSIWHFVYLQEKEAEIRQIEGDNKKMITEIQQRHDIEIIELRETMQQSQVVFLFSAFCHCR